ncbi:MAG: hypothetical protein IJW02_00635 [Clostridia bacterium]|nr:hypothetical protein [Clostridia bacterium]
MKKARILSLVLALIMLMSFALTACIKPTPDTGDDENNPGGKPAVFDLPYAEGTVLRMATGYNSTKTGLSFHADIFPEGQSSITLSNGKTYNVGDLKPTWVEVENVLKVDFEDKYTGTSASDQFKFWQDRLGEVDMVSGTASQLTENGVAGKLVDISKYLDHMPNFKAYLEANPIVRLSITGDTETGAIYFSPYFDGVNDIERMPLMRTDWVEKLLNGKGEFTADASKNLADASYTPYMPTTGTFEIDVVKADGSGVEKVTKNYTAAGNIIAKMNEELAKGAVTGVQAVNMLRTYIDTAYNGYYGENRADLFIGQNAAWDADELVALLRCVVANPQTLNGTDTVQGLFSREDNNNQRKVDMFRFAGTLFGVRGLESRQDYLYIGHDGLLHDARQEEATYVAIERMNAMAKEGLISTAYVKNEAGKTDSYLQNDNGFMHYDYNQTQTVYNETKLQAGEKYMAVLVPVARWNDGTGETFMRFTESWRSVKTDGWGISAAGVAGDNDKLHAALAIIDYAYSEKGMILMSYGPDEFIKTKADGSYVTFNFNGQQMPVIADSTYEELWSLASGNYTNYARMYLGSTLSFAKSQAFEYQCTHAVGKEGAGKISTAIGLGVIKHPELAITENPWWTSVPTVLPNTADENAKINELADLTSSGKFSQSKGKSNILIDFICAGYEGSTVGSSAAEVAAKVAAKVSDGGMGGETYLAYKNDAWDRLVEYYEDLNK